MNATSTATTWGFGRPFVMPLTTPELRAVFQENEIPRDETEAIMQSGAQLGLFIQKNRITPEELKAENEELEEANSNLADPEELEAAQERVKTLKEKLTAMCDAVDNKDADAVEEALKSSREELDK